MLYIVTALKPEAQAFIDKYRLSKSKIQGINYFYSDFFTLVVSGVGVENSYKITKFIIDNFEVDKNDIFLNIGICGASSKYAVGELLKIGSVSHNDKIVSINSNLKNHIVCLDKEAEDDTYEIVDMESYGFYKAVNEYVKIEKFYIFKVVSDHFKPSEVTKEATKSLIFNVIDEVTNTINKEEL